MDQLTITAKSINFLTKARKPLYLFSKKLLNYVRRPKLRLSVKSQDVWFSNNSDKFHFPYLCIHIENITKNGLYLNLNRIYINNEKYQGQKPLVDFDDSESRICLEFKNRWVEIGHDTEKFFLKPFGTEILPLKPVLGGSHTITSINNQSLLFFNKSKICLFFEINNKTHAYGINRKAMYEKLINYLAFYHQRQF